MAFSLITPESEARGFISMLWHPVGLQDSAHCRAKRKCKASQPLKAPPKLLPDILRRLKLSESIPPLDEGRVTPAGWTLVCSQVTRFGLPSTTLLLLSQRKHHTGITPVSTSGQKGGDGLASAHSFLFSSPQLSVQSQSECRGAAGPGCHCAPSAQTVWFALHSSQAALLRLDITVMRLLGPSHWCVGTPARR